MSKRARKPRPKSKRPNGRPPVLTDEKRREIIAILSIGGSRCDAADYVGCSVTTLADTAKRDAGFSESLKRAEAGGKIRLLRKIENASDRDWKAAAWKLERKYPQEYGRRTVLEHSGPDGKPIKTAQTDVAGNDVPSVVNVVFTALTPEDIAKAQGVKRDVRDGARHEHAQPADTDDAGAKRGAER